MFDSFLLSLEVLNLIVVRRKQHQKLKKLVVGRCSIFISSQNRTASWKAVLDPPGLSGCMAKASLPHTAAIIVHAGHVYKGRHV